MKRFYSAKRGPKYHSGKWSWDDKTDSLQFTPHNDLEEARERYIETNGYKFLRTINQEEQLVFRQKFMRSENTFDSDTVITSDVRDLVIFLMPKEFLSKKFLAFLHETAVYRFIKTLNMYFEYFLRLVEFVLIRRDELNGNMGQVQSQQTIAMKRVFSIYLSQYRMLAARNYSVILKGEGRLAKYYHTHKKSLISSTVTDKLFHEQFLAVATQMVWISMHRRAYGVIEMEMNRLFRSEHLLVNRPGYLIYTAAEKSFLYGRRNKICNYDSQVSPLILELQNVPPEDLPILWIGKRKYRGTDKRIAALELEYIIPSTQLHFIEVARGIMGHPKRLYDVMLQLNWHAVREEHYSIDNDPYQILRQPELQIPSMGEEKMHEAAKHYESFFGLHYFYEPRDPQVIARWLKRESIIASAGANIIWDIYDHCQADLRRSSKGPKLNEIIAKYLAVVSRFRKSAQPGLDA